MLAVLNGLLDYRENERFCGKNPSMISTVNRITIHSKEIRRMGFHRIMPRRFTYLYVETSKITRGEVERVTILG